KGILRSLDPATAVRDRSPDAGLVPGTESLVHALVRPAVLPQQSYHEFVGSPLAFHAVYEVPYGMGFRRHIRRQYSNWRPTRGSAIKKNGDSGNWPGRSDQRLAEKEPADNSVSDWIGVGHPDSDMAAQIPNKVLTAGKSGNHASVQQVVVRIKNVDPLRAARGIPIEHVKGDLVQAGISEMHIDSECGTGIPACRDTISRGRGFL